MSQPLRKKDEKGVKNEAKKISPHNLALYNKKGEIEFFWTKKETGSSSMKNIQERKNINKVKCKTDTLDNFVKENKTRVDMIKCDIEGSELFVFQGSQEVLQKDKPFIFTEMLRKWSTKFDYHPNDIIKLLTGIGYRCFAYEENRLIEFVEINSDTKPTNYFFLHEEKHRDVIKTVY